MNEKEALKKFNFLRNVKVREDSSRNISGGHQRGYGFQHRMVVPLGGPTKTKIKVISTLLTLLTIGAILAIPTVGFYFLGNSTWVIETFTDDDVNIIQNSIMASWFFGVYTVFISIAILICSVFAVVGVCYVGNKIWEIVSGLYKIIEDSIKQ